MKLPKLHPRFKQFSLRAFLLVVTAMCIWLSIWTYRARTQQRAATAIREAGGRVTYFKTSTFGTPPLWMIDAVGPDFFFGVDGITLYPEGSQAADDQITLLNGLYDLKKLAIWPGQKGAKSTRGIACPGGLTDHGAEYLLEHQPSLKHLSLLFAKLSDDGCRKLTEEIPSLQLGLHPDFLPALPALPDEEELMLPKADGVPVLSPSPLRVSS
jgi:hypothetical protein